MWFNGRTRASQARDGGSIPLIRSDQSSSSGSVPEGSTAGGAVGCPAGDSPPGREGVTGPTGEVGCSSTGGFGSFPFPSPGFLARSGFVVGSFTSGPREPTGAMTTGPPGTVTTEDPGAVDPV